MCSAGKASAAPGLGAPSARDGRLMHVPRSPRVPSVRPGGGGGYWRRSRGASELKSSVRMRQHVSLDAAVKPKGFLSARIIACLPLPQMVIKPEGISF